MNFWRPVVGATTTWDDRRSVVTIGNFDGVHRGHRHVLERTRALARHLGDEPLPVVAITFDPHPLQVFAPDKAPAALTAIEQRVGLLREAGADFVCVLAFDRQMAAWSPQEFVERALVDGLHAAGVTVGENFRFGARAAGDVEYLRELGPSYGFVVESLALDGGERPWSSTLVRELVAAGDVGGAAKVLGRAHALTGTIVEGDRRGREMGFPTANMPAESGRAVPADGVYAGWLRTCDDDSEPLPAAISVGTNPTFDGADRRVESYVLDRDDLELYGRPVEVSFVSRIRGQVRFTGMADLVDQMGRDVDDARAVLGVPAR